MNRKKTIPFALGLSLFVACAAPAVASPILIDDFSTGLASLTVKSTVQSITTTSLATVPGGERYVQLDRASGSQDRAKLVVAGDFTFAENNLTIATATARYGSATNPLNLDLGNGADAFRFVFTSTDLPATLTISVTSGSTTASTTETIPGGITVATNEDIAFSRFAGIDFSDVHVIQFSITGSSSGDYIVTRFQTIQVPEPVSLALLAPLGLLLRRRTAC